MKVIGFDVHMFPSAGIAIGVNATATTGEIGLRGNNTTITIKESKVLVDHKLVEDDVAIMAAFVRLLGEPTKRFSLRTTKGSLTVDDDGNVFVSDRCVGCDPRMIVKILTFVLTTVIPTSDQWQVGILSRDSQKGGS